MLYIHDTLYFETSKVRLVTPRVQIHGMPCSISGYLAVEEGVGVSGRHKGSLDGSEAEERKPVPGFAAIFFLEFSKGNDLRYISKGFLLAGKRVRHRYPPTRTSQLLHHPPLLRGLPGQFAFLNH